MVRKMKVTQKPPKKTFHPITIVLETEEEAALMWAHLNGGLPDDSELTQPTGADEIDTNMWRLLDGIYHAPSEQYGNR